MGLFGYSNLNVYSTLKLLSLCTTAWRCPICEQILECISEQELERCYLNSKI